MPFIKLSSFDTGNCLKIFEDSGIKEEPENFNESEHRTYQKLLAIKSSQETKHHLNMSKGPQADRRQEPNV